MRYPYEDLGDEQFERLVVEVARDLFGPGVQSFAKGPDGGRDARFYGTAANFPSAAAGWKGLTIIQAKHTNGYNEHFSDKPFSGDAASSTLSEEIERIKILSGTIDNYLLVSNRRLGAIANEAICTRISNECGLPLPSISLAGVEMLEPWLLMFPNSVKRARIDPIDAPLLVSSDDLAEVILGLAAHLEGAMSSIDHPPVPRVPFEEKNRINRLSTGYAKHLQRRFLKYTPDIQGFLADPQNMELLARYQDTIDEFSANLLAKRKQHQNFDELMNYLMKLLFNRDPVLRAHKALTWAMVFYMYWNCDIGETDDVEADIATA